MLCVYEILRERGTERQRDTETQRSRQANAETETNRYKNRHTITEIDRQTDKLGKYSNESG